MSINEHINDYVKPLIMPEKYKARLRVLSTNLSFQPRTVLDIGAYEGHWSQGIKDVFPNCNVFMIEGDEDKYTHLNRTGLPFAIALLSDKEKEVTFHKTNSLYTTGNSIYRELSPTFDHSNPRYYSVQRITQTLSNVVRNNNIKNIDLVKIDVQGSEKDIILGVNLYRLDEEDPIDLLEVDNEAVRLSQIRRLEKLKKEIDAIRDNRLLLQEPD